MIAAIAVACMTATLSNQPAPDPGRVKGHLPVTFTETFFKGTNEGGWTWNGGLVALATKGGNKSWYLRASGDDTFAPQVATAFGIDSQFTGNYRDKTISVVGADFVTERVDFSAAERPISVLLTSDPDTPDDPLDDCTVYFIGADFAPEPGDGWRTYRFGIDTTSSVLPPGWGVLEGCPEATPDLAWNRVIEDVDELRFFYGDPTNFFIFQQFTIGADNMFVQHLSR